MKVLTIQEPYATFIMQGMKKIETRSWQTKYRGLIYIHAGKSKKLLKEITNPDILNLLKNINLNYGNIICKANLIDCVPMTPKFISRIKNQNNNEYLLGKYKEKRYAWILDDIQTLDKKIPAKGKLNIWNYNETNPKVTCKNGK